jgi:uncharacterized protein
MRNIAVLTAMVFVIMAYYAGGILSSRTVLVYSGPESARVLFEPYNFSDAKTATIIVPAVDEDGNGVPTYLIVQALPGSGKALVNIDKLIFWADTQSSMRTARDVAQKYTGIDLSGYDIIYNIKANASVIEGPSAGAALTVATIAALYGKTPRIDVMMTGTISDDGAVGPIGEAMAKARAAKQIGARLFLEPKGQSVETKTIPEKTCSQFGASEVCRIENVAKSFNITREVGIDVMEIEKVGDAVKYFIG